jgi:signal transduction histidine kinase
MRNESAGEARGATADGAAVAALRALVLAAPRAMAVLDETGTLLAANARYAVRSAQGLDGMTRTPFSPGPGSRLTLVTFSDDPEREALNGLLVTVADRLPLILNVKDRDSRYLLMNAYQARLYGTTPEAAIGLTAGDLLGPDYGAYTRRIDAEVIASGAPTPFYEESYAAADSVVRRWLTSKVPVADEAGRIWGVATVSSDITDRVRLEDGLRQAKEEAEAASRAKSGFLAAMSHELRTPLNAVIGFAEILHQQTLGPVGASEYADYAGHILSSGQHLLALINDVLDFARIESGSLVLNVRPVDLGQLLRASLDAITRAAVCAGVELVADVTEQKVIIHADAQRLRQVLINVAGNAVKFTPRGGRVTVTLRPDMRGGAIITVADSGVGIAEADLSRVFEPFWQADTGLDRLRDGAGIGLPLARQLVALHGGRLELESRLGEGTRVSMHLPGHRDAPIR